METQTIPTDRDQKVPIKPVEEPDFNKVSEIDMDLLTPHQKDTLRALADEVENSPFYKALGYKQIEDFRSCRQMFLRPNGIKTLGVRGEDYYRKIEINQSGKKKKVPQRFYKFYWSFYIPGTNSKISVEKEWRYEDFV